jgi:hypothetical protein
MALSGSLEDISFAELLQLLNVSHKSGRLSVWRGTERAELYIVEGEVARAISRRERGREVVYRILGWQEGEFSFQRSDDAVAREITESTEALILEGMKRLDEWERVEAELPDMHVVLRQRAFAVNEQFEELSAAAQTVLRLVDARRDVATIIRESGLEPMEALNGVTELLAEGVVEEWDASAQTGTVIRARGQLPAASGGIDFGRGSYLAPAAGSSPGKTPAARGEPGDETSPRS